MSDLFWLTNAQMAQLGPFFPKSHNTPRIDDLRMLSGITFLCRSDLRWSDTPAVYDPHKTLYNRWKRWSDRSTSPRMMAGLAAEHSDEKTVMIDTTYLNAHRTATGLGVKTGCGRLIGLTKGSTNIKLYAIWDSQGRTLNLFVTAGQIDDYIGARALLSSLPDAEGLVGG